MNEDKRMAVIAQYLLNKIKEWQETLTLPITDISQLKKVINDIRLIEIDPTKYQVKQKQ